MTTFYTADTHFGHRFVAGLRGFEDVEAHDAWLVDRWNAVVGPEDIVYHLGDLSLSLNDHVRDVIRSLNGRIRLVAGNHDRCWHRRPSASDVRRALGSVGWYAGAGIAEVYTSGTILHSLPKIGLVVLSHLPTAGDHSFEDRYADRRPRTAGVVVCGHVHGAWEREGDNINVGVDVRGLAPVSQKDLCALIGQVRSHATEEDVRVDGPWTQFGLA